MRKVTGYPLRGAEKLKMGYDKYQEVGSLEYDIVTQAGQS